MSVAPVSPGPGLGLPADAVHAVQPGETLAAIADLHGVAPEALQAANPQLGTAATLQAGQVLTLPASLDQAGAGLLANAGEIAHAGVGAGLAGVSDTLSAAAALGDGVATAVGARVAGLTDAASSTAEGALNGVSQTLSATTSLVGGLSGATGAVLDGVASTVPTALSSTVSTATSLVGSAGPLLGGLQAGVGGLLSAATASPPVVAVLGSAESAVAGLADGSGALAANPLAQAALSGRVVSVPGDDVEADTLPPSLVSQASDAPSPDPLAASPTGFAPLGGALGTISDGLFAGEVRATPGFSDAARPLTLFDLTSGAAVQVSSGSGALPPAPLGAAELGGGSRADATATTGSDLRGVAAETMASRLAAPDVARSSSEANHAQEPATVTPTAAPIGADAGVAQLAGRASSAAPGGDRVRAAVAFFERQGWTRAQAAGIVANLERSAATGAWPADRQARHLDLLGTAPGSAPLDRQLAFVQHELTHSARDAGLRLRSAASPGEAGALVSRYYERPADADGNASAAARRAQAIHAALA